MSDVIGQVTLILAGATAALYGLFLAAALLSGRASTDALALGIVVVLLAQAAQSLHAVRR